MINPRYRLVAVTVAAVVLVAAWVPTTVGRAPLPRDRVPAPEPWVLDFTVGGGRHLFGRATRSGDGRPRRKPHDGMRTWSRDGKRVAFMANPDGAWRAYSSHADGTDRKMIGTTPSLEPTRVCLLPDGRAVYLAVTRKFRHPIYDGVPNHLWERPAGDLILAGGDRDVVICANATVGEYDTSPDGSKVAYDHQDRDVGRLVVHDLVSGRSEDGFTPADFKDGWGGLFGEVVWRPDGAAVACTFSRRYWLGIKGVYRPQDEPEYLGIVTWEGRRSKTRALHVATADDVAPCRMSSWRPGMASVTTWVSGNDTSGCGSLRWAKRAEFDELAAR